MNLRQCVMGGLLLTQYLENKIGRATKEGYFSCEERFRVCEYENENWITGNAEKRQKKQFRGDTYEGLFETYFNQF